MIKLFIRLFSREGFVATRARNPRISSTIDILKPIKSAHTLILVLERSPMLEKRPRDSADTSTVGGSTSRATVRSSTHL